MIDKKFLKTLTVLYAEDEDDLRESLSNIFSKVFKNLIVCVDGKDGVEQFEAYTKEQNKPIDLVISDISMPKMNGIDMIVKIRESKKNIPIVFTTAHNDPELLSAINDLSDSYYNLKPIDVSLLLESIKTIYKEET
jgi:CheY-like chemotaxis protein